MIKSDQELKEAVNKANVLLQDIQNYVKRDCSIKESEIKFPRGFLRTVDAQRQRLHFISESHLKSNLAYTLMLSDVLHWITVRTDLHGIPQNMVTKLSLFLLGQLIESITKDYLKGKCSKKAGFKKRNEYLADYKIITKSLKDDLDWIWDQRNNMHLFLLKESEYENDYKVPSWNRGVKAFQALLDSIENAKI